MEDALGFIMDSMKKEDPAAMVAVIWLWGIGVHKKKKLINGRINIIPMDSD